jgi:hypothetical protein
MLHIRLDKLRFIIEEMQIALFLTKHLSDPFVARSLARHIVIRAENFIEHARRLRRPLTDAGFRTQNFHKSKEAYATAFEEYFKEARHRLGAHVQDLDFGRRIELWNDIEIIKISYFVDGALEIYNALASENIPGYVAYAEQPALKDQTLLSLLLQIQRTLDSRTWIEMGTDPLAMTRNNTVGPLSTTPVHQRAGQLSLIRRWIALHRRLLDKLGAYPEIVRILKARLVTDIVSFCDCLVTRAIAPGAAQAMDGLDRLISAEGLSSAAIDSYVLASNFQTDLQRVRVVRDKIGAHLEIDTTDTITSLVAQLDSFDLAEGLRFYQRVEAAFLKACHSVIFLKMYAADGQRLYGLTAGRNAAVPFAETATIPDISLPSPPPINDENAYRANLTRWLDGDADQKGSARQFFWDAFAGSLLVETIEEVEVFGAGRRMSRHEFRKSHQFLNSVLSSGLSDSDFSGVIELILSCKSGWPYPLAEILVRYSQIANAFQRMLICIALGEIRSSPHASALEFLEVQSKSDIWSIRLQARLARFKIFVQAEGLIRINPPRRVQQNYEPFVNSLTAGLTEIERMIFQLAMASNLSGPLNTFLKPFQNDYAALQTKIEGLCAPYLRDDEKGSKASKSTTLKQLTQTHDYVGVSVLVAIDLEGGDQNPLHIALIQSCCDGTIHTSGHDQASRHLAMCFVLKKQLGFALEIADGLAARNPGWLDVQILVAQILGEMPGEEDKAAKKVADLRNDYRIEADKELLLRAIEAEIEGRKRRS